MESSRTSTKPIIEMENRLYKRTLIALFALSGALFLFTGCAEQTMDATLTNTTTFVPESTLEQADRVKNIFVAIPSPVEMVTLIQETGSRYNHKVLNDVENRDRYKTAKRKAVNLGIYGADLSYASVFNQNQESILYFSCAKHLADELGVSSAFSEEMMERVEENLEDKDSLLHIITETFYDLDAYLKENDRSAISAQVISGGWLEGLYLASCMAENNNGDSDLIKRLVDQRYALKDLLVLNEAYNTDGSLDGLIADLRVLEEIYDRATTEGAGAQTNIEDGRLVIGGGKELKMKDEDVDVLIAQAKDIRNRYVQ